MRRMLWKSPPESCWIDFSRFLPDKSWNLSEMILRSISLRDTNTLMIVSSSQSEPSQDKIMNQQWGRGFFFKLPEWLHQALGQNRRWAQSESQLRENNQPIRYRSPFNPFNWIFPDFCKVFPNLENNRLPLSVQKIPSSEFP